MPSSYCCHVYFRLQELSEGRRRSPFDATSSTTIRRLEARWLWAGNSRPMSGGFPTRKGWSAQSGMVARAPSPPKSGTHACERRLSTAGQGLKSYAETCCTIPRFSNFGDRKNWGDKPMSIELWDPAVEIAVDNGDHFKSITNTRDALACLMTTWPEQRG